MKHLLAIVIATTVFACSAPQPPLVANDVEVTKPMPGRHMSAGFMTLMNNTSADIRITKVTSPQYGLVEIHETRIEDGVARMRELDALVVPANGSVTLERGGKHLMLMKAGDIGDQVSLQLFSDDAPVLSVDFSFGSE